MTIDAAATPANPPTPRDRHPAARASPQPRDPLRAGAGPLRLGFGVSGPLGTALVSDNAAHALIHQALDGGVRVFDTAPFYGPFAERRLGAALMRHALGAEAIVSTKVGTVWRGGRAHKDFSVDGVRRSMDASAAALGRATLDVVLVHGAPPEALSDGLLAALAAWRRDGRVRALGACGRGAELDPVIASDVFDVIMTPIASDLPPDAAARLNRARAAGMTVVAIEALRPALDPWRAPRRVSDLWRVARTLVRRPPRRTASSPTIAACLRVALARADVVLATTTRSAHLTALMHIAGAETQA